MSKLEDGAYVPCACSIVLRSCPCGNVHMDLKDEQDVVFATAPVTQQMLDNMALNFHRVKQAADKEREEMYGPDITH